MIHSSPASPAWATWPGVSSSMLVEMDQWLPLGSVKQMALDGAV